MPQKSFTPLLSLFVFIGFFNLAKAQNVHQSNTNDYLINPVYLDADSGAFIRLGNYHRFANNNGFGTTPSHNTSSLAVGVYIPRLKSTLSLYHSKQKNDDYWYTNWKNEVSTTAISYNTAFITSKELTLNLAVSGVYTSSNYPYFNESPYYPYYDCIITPEDYILNHNGVKHTNKFRTDIGIRATWKRFDLAFGVNSLLGTDEKIQTYLDAPAEVKKNELYTNLQASYIIQFSKKERGFSIQPKVSIINQQTFNDWQGTLQANLKGQSLGYVFNDWYHGIFLGSTIKNVGIAAQVTWNSQSSYSDFGKQPRFSASLKYNLPTFLSKN